MRQSLKKAQEKYNGKCKMFHLRLNKETESDIIEWLGRGQAGTRIKALIRKDIENSPAE